MKPQIADILERELQQRKERNPSYSIRALARDIGISQSTLSRLLNGKRQLSKKAIEQLLPKLSLSEEEATKIFLAISEPQSPLEDSTASEANWLPVNHFLVQSQWYYDAILELTAVSFFKPNVSWIAECLELDVATTKRAVKRLFELGYLTETEEGKWVDATGTNSCFPFEDSSDIQKIYQRQILEKSLDSLNKHAISERNHSSVTIAASSKRLNEVKKKIHLFQRQIMKLLDEEDPSLKDELYQMQISFFSVLDKKNKRSEK